MFKKLVLFCLLTSAAWAEEDKKPVRVYADIVGDLFHYGHVEFFKKAKELGDVLIIGVLGDDTVESYKRVPVMTVEERAAVIAACRFVDEVIVNPPLRLTEEWIQEHQIDIVAHGDDFNADTLRDQYGTALDLGIMRVTKHTDGVSTTDIIGRIVGRHEEFAKKYACK
jgi:cytidyltransferase-like protein